MGNRETESDLLETESANSEPGFALTIARPLLGFANDAARARKQRFENEPSRSNNRTSLRPLRERLLRSSERRFEQECRFLDAGRISLKIPAKVANRVAYATGIAHAMTNNRAFPTQVPALSTLSAAVSDLQAAETLALTKAKGAAAARKDKRAVVVSLLQQLRGYVQAVADARQSVGCRES